jgi:ribosomal protein L34E
MKNRENSWYACDICGDKLTGINRYIIYSRYAEERASKKIYDLCKKCYRTLIKGIEKGKIK